MTNTYQVDDLSLGEIETLERALVQYQDEVQKIEDAVIKTVEQANIKSIIKKLNRA